MITFDDWFVVAMGIGVVFLGLVLLIAACVLMSCIVRLTTGAKGEQSAAQTPVAAPAAAPAPADIPNRQQTVAAISAAIAEQMGKDVSAIRILSIKKL